MTLDVPTLMLAGAFVALLSGVLLVFAWYQYREMSPVLWWAAADVVLAAGITLLALGGARGSDTLLAAAFVGLTISPALLWTSARLFNGLKPRYAIMLLGPLVVLSINALPAGVPIPAIRGSVATFLDACYLLAAAWTLSVQARERLASRWPLSGLIVVHAAVLMIGAVSASTSSAAVSAPSVTSIFGVIHFEALIFMIGTTIFLVAAMRESSELRHKRAAATDSLTGLANRGAFLERGERLVERCRRDALPFAVIVFDLDYFKTVNDSFGHATGDRVLQLFADIAQKTLRPSDAIGRMGGEEFAAILPGSSVEAACAMAERMRKGFATAGVFIDGQRINATVSAGTAAAEHADVTLSKLMQQADAALYRAKSAGRNRVECERDEQPAAARPRLLRIA